MMIGPACKVSNKHICLACLHLFLSKSILKVEKKKKEGGKKNWNHNEGRDIAIKIKIWTK